MTQLNTIELVSIYGGSEKTYNNGYNKGKEIKTMVVDAWDYVVGFWEGFWGYTD